MSGQLLDVLTREILRWNHQISLVSRVGAESVLAAQVEQCQRAWMLLVDALPLVDWGEGSCWIDVGSGSGLPGLVWSARRQEVGAGGSTLLVEPREKRAWFLNRAARAMGLARTGVMACRWGEERAPVATVGWCARALVSFKALRMIDGDVLVGLEGDPAFGNVEEVVVVRFLWPEAWSVDQLADDFKAGQGGACRGWMEPSLEVLGGDQVRLLVTRYRRR